MFESVKQFSDYLNKLSADKKARHKYYDKTVTHAEDMEVHVDGAKPTKLLDIARPNEEKRIKDYRLSVWQPVTQSSSSRVINTVNRIFNPQLHKIEFPDPPTQMGDETLEKYLTTDYPYYVSLMNFIQETFMPKMYGDPNSFLVIEPIKYDIEDSEMFAPMPNIYESEYVMDFKDEEYLTLSDSKTWAKVITSTDIYKFKKNKGEWKQESEYNHNFGYIIGFRLGGIVKGDKYPYYFESFISGVLPHWNKVVNLTSDIDAGYINHLYLERWEYEADCEATNCMSGIVEVENPDGSKAKVNCRTCNGTGKVSRSPYGVHTIRRDALNPLAPMPTPPAGYIDKPTDIIELVEKKIKREEELGFSAINMDILNRVGEDQSGVAKTIDRQDLDSFLQRIANHVFGFVIPEIIYITANWRYGTLLNGNIIDILPSIDMPKDFSVLSLNFLTDEYKAASTASVSPTYIKGLEMEINNAKNRNNEKLRLKNNSIIKLNPFPKKTLDELLTIRTLYPNLSWKVYMSIAVDELVTKAIEVNQDFVYLDLDEQRLLIEALAKQESAQQQGRTIPLPE
jgi:hypothetical protein